MIPRPHNLEAEQALLGALMFNDGIVERLDALQPSHFFDPVHGRIYAQVLAISRGGGRPDAIALKNWAENDSGMKDLANGGYLLNLMEAAAPLSSQALTYAELIRDLAERRALIDACEAAAWNASRLAEGDAESIIADTALKLASIQTGAAKGQTLRDAASRAVAEASKEARGISTGLRALDGLIGGLFAPDVIVLAGRPSMGKSSLAVNIAHNVAMRGYGVHLASNEMSAEQIAQRALSRASAYSAQSFPYRAFRRGGLPLDHALKLVGQMPDTLIIDESGGQTLHHLRAQARQTRRAVGRLDLIVIDYLQLMRDDAVRRGDTAEVTALTKGVKQLAKDFNVPVLMLSQLSRDVERRDDKRPLLSDLRQSGSIEQDADVVLFAFREHYYLSRAEPRRESGESNTDFEVRYHQWADRCEETSGKMEVIAAKTRMDETGSTFLTVDLAHDLAQDPPVETQRGAVGYYT